MLKRAALWGPLLIAALLIGGYVYLHDPFARDGTRVVQVPLSEEDPALDRAGDLKYLGGIDIPRMSQNIGGLSGLRWHAQSSSLWAITDDARWVWIDLAESGGRLTGIAAIRAMPMLGPDGETLTGKEQGDSESLTRSADGGWLVGFERQHRVMRFADADERAAATQIDPLEIFGALDDNGGLEAMAGSEQSLLLCAERAAQPADNPNCAIVSNEGGIQKMALSPPSEIAEYGAVPTDADQGADGSFYVLFRSYDPVMGNTVGIAVLQADGTQRDLGTLSRPLTVDNFEGLAVREEAGRTFVYIVSDDNFSSGQRTLLMKFEVLPTG